MKFAIKIEGVGRDRKPVTRLLVTFQAAAGQVVDSTGFPHEIVNLARLSK